MRMMMRASIPVEAGSGVANLNYIAVHDLGMTRGY